MQAFSDVGALRSVPVKSDVQESSLAWAHRQGLIPNQNAFKKAAEIRVDDLARRTYPFATGAVLQICSDLLLWFFIADDQFDERRVGFSPDRMEEISENFLQILRTGNPEFVQSPLDRALLNLRERMFHMGTAKWRERFIANMGLYLEGCVAEARNRASGHRPGFDEYRNLRRASVGTYPCFDIIELTLSESLDESVANDSGLVELRDIASDLIAWINDVVSFRKESAYDDPHNVMSVLMAESAMDLQEATSATIRLYEENLRLFMRQAAAVRRLLPNTTVARYISGLESWIRGCHTWSFRSRRYGKDYLQLSKQSSHDLLRHGDRPHLRSL